MMRVTLSLVGLIVFAVVVWPTPDASPSRVEMATGPLGPIPPLEPAAAGSSPAQANASSAAHWKPPHVVYASMLAYKADAYKGADLPDRLSEMSLRRDGRVFDPQEVADALQSDVAWQPDPTIADRMGLDDEERRDGREFVRVNPLRIEALMPGDELSLPIKAANPDNPLRLLVEKVEEGDGMVTWHGRLKDFAEENQVVLTRGESLIAGGVTTPTGHYVLHIVGDIGWVVNGFTLFKSHRDPIPVPGQ